MTPRWGRELALYPREVGRRSDSPERRDIGGRSAAVFALQSVAVVKTTVLMPRKRSEQAMMMITRILPTYVMVLSYQSRVLTVGRPPDDVAATCRAKGRGRGPFVLGEVRLDSSVRAQRRRPVLFNLTARDLTSQVAA